MTTKKQNLAFALGLIAIGLGVMVVLDPWFLGLAFLLIGIVRLVYAVKLTE